MNYKTAALTRALLVGRGSYLAGETARIESDDLLIDAAFHSVDLSSIDFDSYDVVVNMAYDPRYMRESYREESDFDLEVARHIAGSRSHYVMLSTRKVYGTSVPFRITEEFHPEPDGHYGRNKLRSEFAVQELLGNRCTILRIGNVFGFEPGRHTFFGAALRTLKESNKIELDVSPFVFRDFIYVQDFACLLRRTLVQRPSGIFNLGSGCATQLGRIALWIIEGHQNGHLVVTSPLERDNFELDIRKLTSRIGFLKPAMDVRGRCLEIGRKLRNA